jgi:peptidyl-prolyl cis-trans isomerase D
MMAAAACGWTSHRLRMCAALRMMAQAFDQLCCGPWPSRATWQDAMLRGLRKASSNLAGKIIMGSVVAFLIGSFAIWGINDIFRGFGLATAAKVGRTEISTEQFRQIYNDKLQQIGRQIGKPITSEQARALGFDRQILAQLTAEIALDERARALRLGLSDAEIARRITTQPAFQSPSGAFDAARFQQAIRQAGYTEQRFVAEERRNSVRSQLSGTIMGGPLVPKAAIEAMDRYQNEQRSAEYVLLDHDHAGDVAAPTPEALAQYFERRKILFRAPEFRKIQLLTLIPSDQASWIEVADDDIKRAYEEHRDSFGTPERRQLQQMVFPSIEAATADAERIAKGASFIDVAKERGAADKDIDLGTLTKSSMIDRAVADAAFALKEGETSEPVQGRFGVTLIHVVKIEPEKIRPLAEVAPEIKRTIATERAKAQILSVYDKIEDVRSEGHTLAEAAATLKLASRSVEVDRSGHDPAGMSVKDLPDAQRLLAAAFSTEVGVDADPLQVQDGYVWYEVEGITPSRDRPLEEVKDRVEASWRADETATRLKDKAAQILEKLKAGSTLAELAAADGLKLETITGLKRGAASPPLSAAATDRLFVTAKDAAAGAEAEQPGEQVVFRVTDIVVPTTDMNSDEARTITQNLRRSLADDVFTQYIAQVQREIGVTINANAVRQVVSGTSNNSNNLGDDTDINF